MKRETREKLLMFGLWNATMFLLGLALEVALSGVDYKSNLVDDYEYDHGGSGWNFAGQTEQIIYESATAQFAHELLIYLWLFNLLCGLLVDSLPFALGSLFKKTLSENRIIFFKRLGRVVLASTPIVILIQIIVHLLF